MGPRAAAAVAQPVCGVAVTTRLLKLEAADLSARAAYPERREPVPPWHDRAAQALYARVLQPLARRLRSPAHALAGVLPRVQAHAGALAAADAAALAARIAALRLRLRREGLVLDAAAEALAVASECAHRALGQRPYPVQQMAAWALLQGRLAEMATGEGKTLTAGLAGACAALAGLPVHVVTVNDYLAERDAASLQPLFDLLGLRVGVVLQGQPPEARRAAYACALTYCTNKELAFDYLKDRVALARGGGRLPMAAAALAGAAAPVLLLRGLHFAIVDEADSVFIDEARTPLILSATVDAAQESLRCGMALQLAEGLVAGTHYLARALERSVRLTPAGEAWVADAALALSPQVQADAVWASARGRRELVQQALVARLYFLRDQHYVVADDKVHIVDESTGRVMPDRSWEAGLHQMIEAKESVGLPARRVTLARITYQRLFRRYLRLAGMTGTGREVAAELKQVYGLSTVTIPLHRPSRRQLLPARLLPSAVAQRAAVVQAVQAMQRSGRPVLIGTRSVAASERVSAALAAAGIGHALLNARQDKDEAVVVAGAGAPGRVTVATNMAGRGTDIALAPGVAAAGGLHVILTECHASARIDRQLFGRGARQGDAGSAQRILAADDEVLQQLAAPLLALALRWRGGTPGWLIQALCRAAQARAGWRDAAQRRATLQLDERLDRMLAFAGHSE